MTRPFGPYRKCAVVRRILSQPPRDGLAVMHSWKGRFHCSSIRRENALAIPCPERAVRTYLDAQGVSHSWCPKHVSEGIASAARHGWEPVVDERVAAA